MFRSVSNCSSSREMGQLLYGERGSDLAPVQLNSGVIMSVKIPSAVILYISTMECLVVQSNCSVGTGRN